LKAIRAVNEGRTYLPAAVPRTGGATAAPDLSAREVQVLELIVGPANSKSLHADIAEHT